MNAELSSALKAVRQAAAACRFVQQGVRQESLDKRDKSPVTVADFASQALICRQLQRDFEADPVIAEEGADQLRSGDGEFLRAVVDVCGHAGESTNDDEVCQWVDRGALQEYRSRFWTLDPIDGTKGFLRNDQYAISLALIVDGQIKLGVLGCPSLPVVPEETGGRRGVIAWAVRGEGAWSQPIDQPDASAAPLRVTATTSSEAARFCESVESGHSSHGWSAEIARALGIVREPFRIDSQCKYLAVARGQADIYLRLPTRKGYQEKIWDHAGGVILVEEAGGKVTDIHGRQPDFTHGPTLARNEGMVVSNGKFHDRLIEAIAATAD